MPRLASLDRNRKARETKRHCIDCGVRLPRNRGKQSSKSQVRCHSCSCRHNAKVRQ